MMKTRLRWAALPVAAALLLGACGDDEDGDDDGATTTEAPGETTTAPDDTTDTTGISAIADATVNVASSDLGDILVDSEGLTLYVYADDEEGVSNCTDACADGWPPLLADEITVGDGVTGELTVIERADGEMQVAVGGLPLYRFAGDGGPGDTTGQGIADVWAAVAPDGTAIEG